MAKKKLNKRAVAILVAVLALMLIGVAAWSVDLWLPKDPADLAEKGDEAAKKGDYQAAEKFYKEAVAASREKNPVYLAKLANVNWEMVQSPVLAESERRERFRTVLQSLRKATRLDPNYVEPQEKLCDIYWDVASRGGASWTEFIAEADKLLRVAPDRDETYVKRAIAKAAEMRLRKTRDPQLIEAVLADFRAALELRPGSLAHTIEMVRFLHEMNMPDEVEKAFDSAIRQSPDSAELRASYADYLRRAGRPDDALVQVEEAIRRQPDSTVGYLARAEHYRQTGDLPAAIKSLDEAMGIDDSDYRVYRMKAEVLLEQRLLGEAAEAVRKGIQTVGERMWAESQREQLRRLETTTVQLHATLADILLNRLDRRLEEDDPQAILREVRSSLDLLNKAIPDRPERARIAGLLAFAEGRLQEATVLLEQARAAVGGALDLPAIDKLASAYQRLGQPSRAQQVLDETARLTGGESQVALLLAQADLKMLSRDYAGAQSLVAEVLAKSTERAARARDMKSVLDVLTGDKYQLPADTTVPGPHLALLLERAAEWIADRDYRGVVLLEGLHRKVPDNRAIIGRLLTEYLRSEDGNKVEALVKEADDANNPDLANWIREALEIRREQDPGKRFELLKARLERQVQDPLERALDMWHLCASMGRSEEASNWLQEAIRLEPNHPAVIDRAFGTCLQQKDWASAETWAQRAAGVNADGMGGRVFAARLALAREDLPKAIEILKAMLEVSPGHRKAKTTLAECYVATRRLDEAQALYEEVLRADASFAPAVLGMALLTAMQNRPEEHRAWIERAHQLPDARRNPYVQAEMLKIMEARAKPEDLPKLIDERVRRLQNDPNDLGNALALALLMERAGQPDNTEKLLRHVYQMSASKLLGAPPLAMFYARSGRAGDLEAFLVELKGAEPDQVGVQILAGETLAYSDIYRGERAYQEAIRIDANDPRGHLALGRFLDARGRWKGAAQAYRDYLRLVPGNRMVTLLAIRCEINDGQLREAGQQLGEILKKNPVDPEALTLRGNIAFRQRKYDDAMADYDLVLRSNPGFLGALLARARLHVILGEPEKARRDLQAVRGVADRPEAIMEYAILCRSLGDTTATEMAYLDILSRQRGYHPALSALGELYLEAENWGALEPRLAEAKRLYPKDASFPLMEYRMWKARKDAGKAIAALEQAVQADPASPAAVGTYLQALVDAGQYDRALAACDTYSDRPQHSLLAKLLKARALAGLNRPAEAQALFIELLKTDLPLGQVANIARMLSESYGARQAPTKLEAWKRDHPLPEAQTGIILGLLYSEAKDYAAGIQAVQNARSAPAAAEDRITLAVIVAMMYYNDKQYAQAEKTYLELLGQSPDNLQVLNNLAYLYANDLNDAEKALPYARRALELSPGNANVVDTYGWVLVRAGQLARGVEFLRRAASMGQPNPIYHYHLACAYEQNGQWAEAVRQYEDGLKLADKSDDPSVRTLLQEGLNRARQKLPGESPR